MSKFIIQGGKKLEGEVRIAGSKNAALPIIASTILSPNKITIKKQDILFITQTIQVILQI